ncbi:MAG: tRNA pseudouridine(55) synthase TruB [Rickettsiales bacterium]|jgi:tRNA pseudouridine55 synthase|nr:tRNA pseudouridine(55) synthase TruB [Rickettsiales bacterium]
MDGWLNIDKPLTFSSAKVVAIVKKTLGAKKVGHGGTLDPLATGVLPICIGLATKETSKIMDWNKEYLFNIKFGETKTTADNEGIVLEKDDFIPAEEAILNAIPKFIGKIKQVPPIFSAIKVNGKRAYQLAVDGKPVELKARDIVVHSLEFKGWKGNGEAQFLVKCGKGFYVRSFGVDFAKEIGALGHISCLHRVAVGKFDANNMTKISEVKKGMELLNIF